MAPKGAESKGAKGKGGKVKKAGKKNVAMRSATLLDGQPVSEMSREQLLSHLTRLMEQLEKEREERNYFQLERDQLFNFWKVAKVEAEQNREQLRIKERQLEDGETLRQNDSVAFKQQIKMLLHEHQVVLVETQAQHQSELELCKLRHQEQDFEMRQEKMLVDEQLRKVTCSQQETINELKLQHACQLSTVRQNNELQCRQLEDQFQERLRQVRSQLEQRRASDLNELNEHNAKHAEQLKRNHQDALIEMKNYYNDIVMNNMTLITSLKEQNVNSRQREERLGKRVLALEKELADLSGKCQSLQGDSQQLRKESQFCDQIKSSLKITERQHKNLNEQLESACWQKEVLQQSYAKVKRERDDLQDKFMAAILEVQQKANLKQLVLQKKLEAMQKDVSEKDHQIQELTSNQSLQATAGMDSSSNSSNLDNEQRARTVVTMNFKKEGDPNLERSPSSNRTSSLASVASAVGAEKVRSADSSYSMPIKATIRVCKSAVQRPKGSSIG